MGNALSNMYTAALAILHGNAALLLEDFHSIFFTIASMSEIEITIASSQ